MDKLSNGIGIEMDRFSTNELVAIGKFIKTSTYTGKLEPLEICKELSLSQFEANKALAAYQKDYEGKRDRCYMHRTMPFDPTLETLLDISDRLFILELKSGLR